MHNCLHIICNHTWNNWTVKLWFSIWHYGKVSIMMHTYCWFLRGLSWRHLRWCACMDWFVAGSTKLFHDCCNRSDSIPIAEYLTAQTSCWRYKAVVIPTIAITRIRGETTIGIRHGASVRTCLRCCRGECQPAKIGKSLDGWWCHWIH